MSKTKLNKKSFKIIGATSVALFSLVTVFTATIAWFAMNYTVGGDGIKIKVNEHTGKLNKIEIFEYVETIDKGTGNSHNYNFSFKNTPSATIYGGEETTDDIFAMGDYNPLDTDHPLLVLFTLKDEFVTNSEGDMYIKGLTSAEGFLGETDSVTGLPVYKLGDVTSEDPEGTKTLKRGTKTATVLDGISGQMVEKVVDCYPLSSAINFKCAQYSEDQYETLTGNSTDNRIDIPTNSITLSESFVNFATSGAGITFKQNPTIFSSPGDGSSILYVAMIVNYDANAISAIYSTYLGDSTLEGTYGGQIYFTCDWILEVL